MEDEAAGIRKHLWAGAALILLCLALAGSAEARIAGAETSAFSGEFVKGEIIVKVADGATDGDLERINDRNGAETEEELPRSDLAVVDLPNDLTVAEAVEIYEDSPDIEYAEPDYILRPAAIPNDAKFSSLYAMHNTGQTGGSSDADIDAPEAWDTATGSQETIVAVIDGGMDIEHPDLRENIWVNPDEVAGNGEDDDGNGYVDDVNGWDFANEDASVYDPDAATGKGEEHGTHVAGTIAARGDNGIGVVGVSWRASIMPLKFLKSGGGKSSDAAEAIDYAIAEGADISNNSWGGSVYSQTLRDAISRADAVGHLFVAAAGNDGANNNKRPYYPASYNLPNIISVASSDNRDALSSFSNFGASSVDLAAPGSSIVSTLPGDGYGSFSGTSMATPHVAGVAALLEGQNPDLDDAQLKSRILGSVDKKSGLARKVATGGRLNAANALSGSAEPPDTTESPDTTAPAITPLRPKPETTTNKRSVGITAVVRDDRTNLAGDDIDLYVDGRKRSFQYDAGGDRLSASSGKLAYGAHTIRVVATDDTGNKNARSWGFRVVR